MTGCTSSGSGSVVLTASAAADMVGNVGYVVSGTNFNTGLMFEVTSVSVGVSITFSTNGASNICTGVGALGAINIGGAKLTLNSLGSATSGVVAGNLICVKADGAYTLAATDTMAGSGTSTSPIRIVGYSSTRPTVTTHGDYYLGRTNSNGPLITTNLPALNYNSTFRLNVTGSWIIVEGLNFSGSASSALVSGGADGALVRCLVTNSSTNAAAAGIDANARMVIFDNDATLSGASGGAYALRGASASARLIGNRCKVASSGSTAVLSISSSAIVAFNTIIGSGGVGISLNSNSSSEVLLYNTVVGCADAINVVTGTTVLKCFVGNMCTDNSGDGLDMVSTGNAAFLASFRTRDNGSSIANGGSWITSTSYGNVTTGAGTSDYVNYAGLDLNLVATSPAVSAAIPLNLSMGALQRSQTGGGAFVPTVTIGAEGVFVGT